MAEPLVDRERYLGDGPPVLRESYLDGRTHRGTSRTRVELVAPVDVLPGDECPVCAEGPGFCGCPAPRRWSR